ETNQVRETTAVKETGEVNETAEVREAAEEEQESRPVARPLQGRERAADLRQAQGTARSSRDDMPGAQGEGRKVVDITRGARVPAEPSDAPETPAPAAPSVRRMARELGVDVDEVAGSGPGGRIAVDDVKAHAKRLVGVAIETARKPG